MIFVGFTYGTANFVFIFIACSKISLFLSPRQKMSIPKMI